MSTLIKTLEAYPRLNIFIPLMCIIWEDQLVSPAEQDLMIQYLSTQDWLMEEEKSILLHWVRPGPGYEPLPFDDMILEVRNALVKEGTPSDLGLIDLGLKLYHSKLQVSPSPIASSALKFQDVLGALNHEAFVSFLSGMEVNCLTICQVGLYF